MDKKSDSGLFRFFKWILATLRWYFLLLGILVTLLFFSLFKGAFTIGDNSSDISVQKPEGPLFLHMKLEGEITDSFQESTSSWQQLIKRFLSKQEGISVYTLRNVLTKAAKDPQIKGVFLEVREAKGSLTVLSELHAAFRILKEAKKPVYSWLATANNFSYMAASVAEHVSMSPVGQMMLLGSMVQVIYFAKTFEKLGLQAELIKTGVYKSAGERFTLNKPSSAVATMLRSLRLEMQKNISTLTHKARQEASFSEVEAWYQKSIFHSEEALKHGVVDQLAYLENVKNDFAKKLGAKPYLFSSYGSENFVSSLKQSSETSKEGLALIEASGEIRMSKGQSVSGEGAIIAANELVKKLDWALKEEKIKAVIFKISSPGGDAIASDLIAEKIKELVKKKPVVTLMGSQAASGGYYIAAPTSKIIANASTVTGSIGVFGLFLNLKKAQEKFGFNFYQSSGSLRQDVFHPGRSLSDQDQQELSQQVSWIYTKFLEVVAAGRRMKIEDVKKIAEGRVWTGSQARELGLVDKIGGFYQAVDEAKKLAKFDLKQEYPLYLPATPEWSLAACLKDPGSCLSLSSSVSLLGMGNKAFTELDYLRLRARVKSLSEQPLQALSFFSEEF